MNARRGFTLVELLIAVFIFGYIAASLSTIYSTSHNYMFQNYRSNIIKTGVLLSMRAIQNNLGSATRVDSPAWSPVPGAGTVLDFAVNVDKLTSCYPISTAVPASWHHFCVGPDPLAPGYNALYYHTANLGGAAPGQRCGGAAGAPIWNGVYPVPGGSCGAPLGGQTVIKLMQYVDTSAGYVFSRRPAEGVNDSGSVRVRLRSRWDAAAQGMGRIQRNVDFTLDTAVRANCPN